MYFTSFVQQERTNLSKIDGIERKMGRANSDLYKNFLKDPQEQASNILWTVQELYVGLTRVSQQTLWDLRKVPR